MGTEGLKTATEIAIVNSNYLKDSLKDDFTIIDVMNMVVLDTNLLLTWMNSKKLILLRTILPND